MSMADLAVKNGVFVTVDAELPGVGIAAKDGVVVAVGRDEDLPDAQRVVDAKGNYILPGVIDCHVHLREPGLEYKEDLHTGTLAAAMGGVTCVIDMPNTIPPTATRAAVEQKARLTEGKAFVDVGFFGLVAQDNLQELEPMRDAGVVGYKCYLGETTGRIPAPDDGTLVDAMRAIAGTGLRVGFHAENDAILQHMVRKLKDAGRTDARAHLESRPLLAELEAIQRLALFASHTACKVHVFHVSSSDGMEMVAHWRGNGVDVTCETCPQYLFLEIEEYERQGSVVRINPPVRGRREHGGALLQGLVDGRIDMVATDHSPHTREEKINADIWRAVSGFVGVETSVPLLLTEAVHAGRMRMQDFVRVTSYNPARAWNLLPRKGCLQLGSDADVTIIDVNREAVIDSDKLHSKNRVTPFHGWKITGMPAATIARGHLVMEDGQLVGEPRGRPAYPLGLTGTRADLRR